MSARRKRGIGTAKKLAIDFIDSYNHQVSKKKIGWRRCVCVWGGGGGNGGVKMDGGEGLYISGNFSDNCRLNLIQN